MNHRTEHYDLCEYLRLTDEYRQITKTKYNEGRGFNNSPKYDKMTKERLNEIVDQAIALKKKIRSTFKV